jgi:phosphonopyruvate decarboxylase
LITAESFVDAARVRGFDLYAGVPCSYLTPLINHLIGAEGLDYVAAANEGDAVAIAAGAVLGGRRAAAMFQNSGLGNAVSPLTSLTWTFRLPVLLVVTWRGEPGGAADEPQHELTGAITPRQLELMEIRWRRFPSENADIAPSLDAAEAHIEASRRPFALVMSRGAVAAHPLAERPAPSPPAAPPPLLLPAKAAAPPALQRRDVLAALQEACGTRDVLLATTGYAGRELYALDDRPNQLYMIGSMGCVSSLGLGLALARPDRRVVAIDGDGAALMRLGAMATIGAVAPANLVHLVIDNAMHESTGGQATASATTDFCAVAAACGYARLARPGSSEELKAVLAEPGRGPLLVHVRVRPGTPEALPRPSIAPADVAARLSAHLEA